MFSMPRFPAVFQESLGRAVNVAARAMRALLDARLAEAGMSFATWISLMTLASSEGPLGQGDLASRIEIEGPTMVRRLDQLEAAGLVERTADESDRRRVSVTLTPKGKAAFAKVRSSVEATEKAMMEGLDAGDVEATRRVLKELTQRSRTLRMGT